MQKSKSILWTAVKSIIVNTLIVLAFSGLFRSSLLIDKPSYGFYGATLITLMYMFIRPLLMFISIVPIIMTFGIFIVVINAGIILLVSYLLAPHFIVSSFECNDQVFRQHAVTQCDECFVVHIGRHFQLCFHLSAPYGRGWCSNRHLNGLYLHLASDSMVSDMP